jgi:hypothetical protein
VNAWNGYAWQGNVADPPDGLVTDGHSMIVLPCSPIVAGIVLEWDEGEKYDSTDDLANRPPRRVPVDKCWELWHKYLALSKQRGEIAETHQSIAGPFLRLNLEDGSAAWLRPQIAALIAAAVRFDRITQVVDGTNLGPVHFWQYQTPVACMMPLKPTEYSDLVNATVLEYRPAPAAAER